MAVLVIRANKRFTVRQQVRLRAASGDETEALLIEISSEGCRLSGIGEQAFETSDLIEFELPGAGPRAARVRWSRPGSLGLKLEQPLHNGELSQVVALGHEAADRFAQERLYGT